nr:proline-rich protein 2-like [Taeniopygia guttata]
MPTTDDGPEQANKQIKVLNVTHRQSGWGRQPRKKWRGQSHRLQPELIQHRAPSGLRQARASERAGARTDPPRPLQGRPRPPRDVREAPRARTSFPGRANGADRPRGGTGVGAGGPEWARGAPGGREARGKGQRKSRPGPERARPASAPRPPITARRRRPGSSSLAGYRPAASSRAFPLAAGLPISPQSRPPRSPPPRRPGGAKDTGARPRATGPARPPAQPPPCSGASPGPRPRSQPSRPAGSGPTVRPCRGTHRRVRTPRSWSRL